MNRVTRLALSAAVVLIAAALGWLLAALVLRAIPGVPIGSGFVEATPVHLFAFEATFLFVTFVGALVGLLYVWRWL